MMPIDKWYDRFMHLARVVGGWSKDPSTKVGAVIVRPDRTIASVGYNGFPRGVDDSPDVYEDRPTKYMRVVHAEANAILSAQEPLHGYSIYVTPLHPCANCAGLIIQSGIKYVYFEHSSKRSEAWEEHYKQMMIMFQQGGVEWYSRSI